MRALKQNSWATSIPKGTYNKVNPTAITPTVRVSCPDCGKVKQLDGHHISPEGEVTPPILCDCGFHESVQLVGWTSVRAGVPTAMRKTHPGR